MQLLDGVTAAVFGVMVPLDRRRSHARHRPLQSRPGHRRHRDRHRRFAQRDARRLHERPFRQPVGFLADWPRSRSPAFVAVLMPHARNPAAARTSRRPPADAAAPLERCRPTSSAAAAATLSDQAAVDREIVLRHAARGEALLEALADLLARQLRQAGRPRRSRRSSSSTMKPVRPSSITSGTEPRLKAMTGVPQAIASIITRPNGSGQSIGTSRAIAPLRNSDFSSSVISPMYSTFGAVDHRLDLLVEIFLVGPVDLGGDLQRHAALLGDADGAVDALFRRDAAEEGEIARLDRLRRQQLARAGRDGPCAPSRPAAAAAAAHWRSTPPAPTQNVSNTG